MACISIPIAAAVGIAGTVASSALAPGAPSAPNLGTEEAQTLQAQINLAPQQFAAESNPSYGQPAYSALQLQNLNTLLYGTPGTTATSRVNNPAGYYDAQGNLISTNRNFYGGTGKTQSPTNLVDFMFGSQLPQTRATPGGNGLIGQPPSGVTWKQAFTQNGTTATPAEQGLLAMSASANTAQRQADINDVMNLGPEATQAMLNADPYNAQLLAGLNASANDGLAAGSNLTPDEQRAMQQQSRAAFAARGMGGDNGAIADELLQQFNLGQQLLTQRQQFAQSLVGTNQAVLGDPFQQILSRSSGAVPSASAAFQQSGPQLFNPQAGLGLAESNYSVAAQQAAANNPLATLGGTLGGVGKLISGIGAANQSGTIGGGVTGFPGAVG